MKNSSGREQNRQYSEEKKDRNHLGRPNKYTLRKRYKHYSPKDTASTLPIPTSREASIGCILKS